MRREGLGRRRGSGDYPLIAEPVTLHDTDVICGVYRERMIEAQKKHLPTFQATMRE